MDTVGAKEVSLPAEWRQAAWLFAAGFLLYAHTLSFGLTWFDDDSLLEAVLGGLKGGLAAFLHADVFLSGATAYYRPLLPLSLAADALAGGPHYFFFHLTNVLLHAACGPLLYRLLRRLGGGRTPAFFLALAWLCHPSLAQAAAWLPGRNDSLLTLFSLAAGLCFLRFLRRPAALPLAGFSLAFLCALLTKETALLLPAPLLYYALAVSPVKLSARAGTALAAAAALPAAAWLALRSSAALAGPVFIGGLPAALAAVPLSFLSGLGRAVFPLSPSVWTTSYGPWPWLGLAAAAAFGAVFRLSAPERRPAVLFGLLWFALLALPALAAGGGDYGVLYFEHRLHLPLAGLAIALAASGLLRGLDEGRPLHFFSAAALVLLFASVAFAHSFAYSGRLAFWERAAEESPANPGALSALAAFYQAAGLARPAERTWLALFAAGGEEPFAHRNLGLIYAARGRRGDAEREFRAEYELCQRLAAANIGFRADCAALAQYPAPRRQARKGR